MPAYGIARTKKPAPRKAPVAAQATTISSRSKQRAPAAARAAAPCPPPPPPTQRPQPQHTHVKSSYFPSDDEEDEFETSSCFEGSSSPFGHPPPTGTSSKPAASVLAQVTLPPCPPPPVALQEEEDDEEEDTQSYTFPASREALWPRTPARPPVTTAAHDVLVPLLFLPLRPLRALHARLLSSSSSSSSSCRGTVVKAALHPTAACVRHLPPHSLARGLPNPPPLTLLLEPPEEGALKEAASFAELLPQLLNQEEEEEKGPISLPVLHLPHPQQTPAEAESDYRTLLSRAASSSSTTTTSHLLSHALGPLRLLAHIETKDTLTLRAEHVLPTLSLSFTPLPSLPGLHNSLWKEAAAAAEKRTKNKEGRGGPCTGFLTLTETRKVVFLPSSSSSSSSSSSLFILPSQRAPPRPLVGVWVSGLEAGEEEEVGRHPFVWAAVLDYLLKEKEEERVCVEEGVCLLACFVGGEARFWEVKLRKGEEEEEEKEKEGFRLLDFTVDLSFEEEEEEEEEGGGGNAWENVVVGQFRETSCPLLAAAFAQAQLKDGGRGEVAPSPSSSSSVEVVPAAALPPPPPPSSISSPSLLQREVVVEREAVSCLTLESCLPPASLSMLLSSLPQEKQQEKEEEETQEEERRRRMGRVPSFEPSSGRLSCCRNRCRRWRHV